MTDTEIIADVLEGNTSRFRLLVERYGGMVRGLCASHANAPSVNDDLVLIRAYVRENGNFGFDYYIPVEGGITKRNIVMATRYFASLIGAVIRQDEDDVMA